MYFSLHNILPAVWVCLGVSLAAIIYLLTVYRSFTRLQPSVKTNGTDRERGPEIADDALPPVSVIVYARDNAAELRETLNAVLTQNYPASRMEVVVVNDGSVDEVTDVVNFLSLKHRNIYITFVPEEAHNLSRKKLAVSLGIKAAKNDVVVLTVAGAHPASADWLRVMAAPFTRGKQIALGWGYIEGLKGLMRRFDEAVCGTIWLSSALRKRPYRGTGFNLAYTRSIFFEAKGFSRSLNLQNGDDDIFINQIADSDNCEVVLEPEALMSVNFQRPTAAYRDLRLCHCFTRRRLPSYGSLMAGSGTAAIWVWLAAVVTGVVFSLPNWFPSLLFAATIPLLWIPLTINWLRTGRTLGITLSPALLWWQMLWRWIPALKYRLNCGGSDRRNFTWHAKKLK